MLWLQGWNNAPEIVRACAKSWQRQNPGWSIRFLTRGNLPQLFPAGTPQAHFLAPDIPPEVVSNVVRLELLARYGGVWADATTYCLMPLDQWLAPAAAHGFFAFDRPARDRMLSTWFLAAPANATVILRLLSSVESYWKGRTERHTYFWFHGLFAELYETDAEVRRIWDAMPKHSAAGPQTFVPYQRKLFGPVTRRAQRMVETRMYPMLKLTHKLDMPESGRAMLYQWLRGNYRWLCGDNRVTLYRWLCDRELGAPLQQRPTEEWSGSF